MHTPQCRPGECRYPQAEFAAPRLAPRTADARPQNADPSHRGKALRSRSKPQRGADH